MTALDLRAKAAHGTMVVSILSVIGTLLERLSQFILPLYLMPLDFGLFALAVSFYGVLGIVGELGMTTYLVRVREGFEDVARTAFVLRLGLSLVLIVGSVGLGWVASHVYADSRLLIPIVVLAMGLILQSFAMVPRAVAFRKLDFSHAAVPDSVGKFVGVFATIALAIAGFAYWSPVYGMIAGLIVGTSLLIATSRWRPKLGFRPETAQKILRFGGVVALSTFAAFIARFVDYAVVGFFLGVAVLGYYSIAFSWGVNFAGNLSSILTYTSYSILSNVADVPARSRRVYMENLRYYTYLAPCLSIGVAVLAPQLVLGIYGSAWSPAIVVMQILAPVGVLVGYGALASDALYALGRPKIILFVSWLEAAILVTLVPPATILFGLLGTGLAVFIGVTIVTALMTRHAARALGISRADVLPLGRNSAITVLGATVAGFAVSSLLPASFPALVVGTATIVFFYVGIWQLLTRGRYLEDLWKVIGRAFS